MTRKPLSFLVSAAIALQGIVPASAAQQPYFRMQGGNDGAATGPGKQTDTIVTVSGGPSGTLVTRIGKVPVAAAPTASPAPVTWSLSGTTAPGIGVDANSGLLSGQALTAKTSWGTMRLQATHAMPDGTSVSGYGAPFSIQVLPLPAIAYPATATVSPGNVLYPSAVTGVAKPSFAFAGATPSGLAVDVATGGLRVLQGASGPYTGLVVAVTDKTDNATATSQPFAITVGARTTSASLPDGQEGDTKVYFARSLSYTGMTAPFAYSMALGTLPPGLGFCPSPDGRTDQVCGTPTTAGTYTFAVTATGADAVPATTAPVTWTIHQPTLTYADTSASAGTAVTVTPVRFRLDGATFALKSPVAGYSVGAATGVVSGTATTGDTTLAVVATSKDNVAVESNPFKVTGKQTTFSMTTGSTYVASHVGYPVSKTYTTNSTATALAWTVTSGALPDGVTLSSTSGVVSGRATAPGIASNVVVTARDAASGSSAASAPVTYKVFGLPTVPVTGPYAGKVGQGLTVALQADNLIGAGRYSTDQSKLPPGVTMSAAGLVSGNPTTAGNYDNIVVSVTDAFDNATGQSQPFSISVAADSNDLAVNGVPAQYAVRQQRALSTSAPSVQNNVCSVTWGLAPESAALPLGLDVDPSTGVIYGQAATSGNVDNVILQATETCTTRSGALRTRIRLASNDPSFRLAQASAGTNSHRTAKSRPFTVRVAPPLSVTNVRSTYALRVASTVAVSPQAQGVLGQTSWTLSGGTLPQTMNFDPATGQIAGPALTAGRVPDTTGTAALTLTAVDSFDGEAAQSVPFAMTVDPGLVVLGPSRFTAKVGVPYTSGAMFIVTNNTMAVSWTGLGNFPPGLSVNGATGEIYGTPTVPGGFSDLRMQALQADGQNGQSAAISITVQGGLSVTAPGYSAGHINKQIAPIVPSVSGQTGAVRWSVQSGSLPPGLGMDPATGALKGIPTALGIYHGIFIGAQDSGGNTGVSAEMTIEVNEGMTWVVTANFPKGRRLAKFTSPPVYAYGGSGKVTYRLAAPIADWTIDPATGVIKGSAQTGYLWGGWLVAVDESGATLDHPTYLTPTVNAFEYPGRSYITSMVGIILANWPGYTFNSMAAVSWTKESPENWPAWAILDPLTGYIRGTPTQAGTFTLTTRATDTFDNTGGTFDRVFTINPNGQPDPDHVGVTYRSGPYRRLDHYFTVPGDVAGNVTWSVQNNPGNGVFDTYQNGEGNRYLGWQQYSANPGFYPNITITATGDAGGSHTWIYDVTVLPQIGLAFGGGSLCGFPGDTVDTGALAPGGLVGQSQFKLIDFYDSPLPYQGNWPAWLNVDNVTGRLYGTVPSDDSATYTQKYGATFTDTYDNATVGIGYKYLQTYAAVGFDLPPQLAQGYIARKPDGYAGYESANQMHWHGVQDDHYYQVTSGTLPEGMVLDNNGQGSIYGTPVYPGTYPITLTLFAKQCGDWKSASKSFNVVVKTPDPAKWISTPVSVYARVGVPFRSAPIPYIANKGSETWIFDQRNGGRPNGVNFDTASGSFYGTPQATWNDSYRLQANSNQGEYLLGSWSQFIVTPGPAVAESDVSVPAAVPAYISPISTGFAGSVTYSVNAAAPTGMAFDPASGSFVGSPSAPGVYGPYVVTGVEDTLPQVGPNDPVPAYPGASSRPFRVTVVSGPYIDAISDQKQVLGKAFFVKPTFGGFTGDVTWKLAGELPLGLQIDPATGVISGTGNAYGARSVNLHASDASGNGADSNTFTLTVTDEDGNVPETGHVGWSWGPQVCTYGCGGSAAPATGSGESAPMAGRAAGSNGMSVPGDYSTPPATAQPNSCSGRQIQNCDGAGCTVATRGCDAPYTGGETSYPVGSWAPECINPTPAPNDRFCPGDTQTTTTQPQGPTGTPTPTTYPGKWIYKNVFIQRQHTHGFVVNSYHLTCYVGSAESPESQCGPAPTTNTDCKMNAYGLGYCDPGIADYTDGNHYNGFSNGYNWYD